MTSIFDDETTLFDVVKNEEEQYSIWPQTHELPDGWQKVGMAGGKSECLEYVEKHWTDMRPASLRRAMDEEAASA